jgi:hypothetical protein
MPNTMRVGFDARWYNDSGVGNYVAGLLNALAEAADDIELIVYEDPANRVPDVQRFQPTFRESAKRSPLCCAPPKSESAGALGHWNARHIFHGGRPHSRPRLCTVMSAI